MMTQSWLLDYLTSQSYHENHMQCPNVPTLGALGTFISSSAAFLARTSRIERIERRQISRLDPMDPTRIGRWKNPPGAAEHLLFHHLVLQKIFDGYPIITTWDRSGSPGSPEFWHPICLSFQNIMNIHEHKTDSGVKLHVKVCSIMFNLISLRPLLKNLRVWYWC